MGMTANRALAFAVICLALAMPMPIGAAGTEVTPSAASEGVQGLRVHFGPDCAAAHHLVLDAGAAPLQGLYEACRTILVHSVTVDGTSATLRAGDQVEIGNGFQVGATSTLAIEVDDSLSGGPTFVQDSSPIDETVYTARFSARLNALNLGVAETVGVLVGYSSTWQEVFRVTIQPASGGGLELSLAARQDGGGMVLTPPGQEIGLPAGWNVVEIEWLANGGNGQLLVAINGGALVGLNALDNAATRIETVRWGGVDGALFTASGSIDLDTYSSIR